MRNSKITKKVVKIIIILVYLIVSIYPYSKAAINTGEVQIGSTYRTEFQDPANTILGILQVVSIFVAIIGLSITGIRYMLGSIDEKAEYKKTLGYYLLGAILAFSITTVLKLIYQMVQDTL